MAFIYSNKDVSDKILRELELRRVSAYKMCKDIDLHKSTFSQCINNKSKWQIDTLTKIAIYLNLTLDYLVYNQNIDHEAALRNELAILNQENADLKAALAKFKNALLILTENDEERTLIGKPTTSQSNKRTTGH